MEALHWRGNGCDKYFWRLGEVPVRHWQFHKSWGSVQQGRAGQKAQYNTGWHRSVAELKPGEYWRIDTRRVLKVTKTRGTQLINWPWQFFKSWSLVQKALRLYIGPDRRGGRIEIREVRFPIQYIHLFLNALYWDLSKLVARVCSIYEQVLYTGGGTSWLI